jgi:regulator of cell morphogenesis and NO signaling
MLDRNLTVAQIVTRDARAARVFQRHAIDFCCHGDVSLHEACAGRDLDPDALAAELEAALPSGAAPEDPSALGTAALVARIVDRHHGTLRRMLPYLTPIAAKVALRHGERNPKLVALRDAFESLATTIEPHLDDEEEVLFPALASRRPDRALVQRELARMRAEHLEVGALLGRIRALADGFAVPPWGCNTYRVLMTELEALEGDVLQHVHLENHVLAPRFEDPS